MAITRDQIISQLQAIDGLSPEIIKHVAYCDGLAHVTFERTDPPQQAQVRELAERSLRQLSDEIKRVTIDFVAQRPPPAGDAPAQPDNPLPDVKQIVAVGAGKGGVGKSTIAVNLAVGLARSGWAVGLMDGDIYGPSLPTMLSIGELEPRTRGEALVPFEVHGIKTMSIGSLVEREKALIWRGPMAHGAFRQLATQTDWGSLDLLVIDLPPGTGDVPLTMSQLLPLAGSVIVCTPQKVAQDDAIRALAMFRQLGVPVLGVVENMSYFVGNDGIEYDIFGRGGAQFMAQQQTVEFLGAVPINMRLRENSDRGDPTANFTGNDHLAADLAAVVDCFAQRLAAAHQDRPTIAIR